MGLEINNYRIEQGYEYQGDDWWDWWLWIEGSDSDLDDIDYVTYRLHPTFRPSMVEIKDRESNFRLTTSGWGVFRIYAKVVLKDGSTVELKHDLTLTYPDNRINLR